MGVYGVTWRNILKSILTCPKNINMQENNKCSQCGSDNTKICDNDFASRKKEGEPAERWDGKENIYNYCWDCENK